MFEFLDPLRMKHSNNTPQRITILWLGMALSTVCTLFFAMDVFGDMVFGRDFPDERTHQILELFVVLLSSFSVLGYLFERA